MLRYAALRAPLRITPRSSAGAHYYTRIAAIIATPRCYATSLILRYATRDIDVY